jgi:hypothetical protein
MNLLPFENIEIESPLSKSEVVNTVRRNIEWKTDLGMTFTKNSFREYEGYTENNTFKLRRILKSGINTFIPIVTGTVLDFDNDSSRIVLKLRLHKGVMIFGVVMTIFAGILLVTSLLSSPLPYISSEEYLKELSIDEQLKKDILSGLSEPPKQEKSYWSNLLLFVTPYLIFTLFFNFEANTVKDKLYSILYVKN